MDLSLGLISMNIFSIGLVGLLCLILWIWALVDIVRSRFRDESTKIIWCLLVVFLPFLGTILYLVIGRGQRM